MIKLFHIPDYTIETKNFNHLLHDSVVTELEENFCDYVGAKYACSINSATSAIFLCLLNKNIEVDIPSIIPPVVCNTVITSGNRINFVDNVEWVGGSYVLHDFGNYKVVDSAQKVERKQFIREANHNDLMIFSFYPTKPIGSCDGGIIVSNDWEKIKWFKEACLNGTTFSKNNWERKIKFPGYKMYMNSFQAFIANENLNILDHKNQRLKEIRSQYNSHFKLENQSNHLYRINVANRSTLIPKLKLAGIPTGIHYKALHENKIYCTEKLILPNSEKEAATTLSLPFHEKLTQSEIQTILKNVDEYADFY